MNWTRYTAAATDDDDDDVYGVVLLGPIRMANVNSVAHATARANRMNWTWDKRPQRDRAGISTTRHEALVARAKWFHSMAFAYRWNSRRFLNPHTHTHAEHSNEVLQMCSTFVFYFFPPYRVWISLFSRHCYLSLALMSDASKQPHKLHKMKTAASVRRNVCDIKAVCGVVLDGSEKRK